MSAYLAVQHQIQSKPVVWLITGVAGFIGSNLMQKLLSLDQYVVGLDNFATGHQRNIDDALSSLTPKQGSRFRFILGDIADLDSCRSACEGVAHVLHQAALGSVPRSIKDPITTNRANVDGFLNMMVAARDAGVRSFTYAASSSTYGDHPALPKREEVIGKPLSPYAVTKYVNELYAEVFGKTYGFSATGLRYFNVFGRRQDPDGAYAAVIPRWTAAMISNKDVLINGDGYTSRDFCYIDNVVQANLLAAARVNVDTASEVYNVAVGGRTTLSELFEALRRTLHENGIVYTKSAVMRDFRTGDVRHSQADITKIQRQLGYLPEFDIYAGLAAAMPWYVGALSQRAPS